MDFILVEERRSHDPNGSVHARLIVHLAEEGHAHDIIFVSSGNLDFTVNTQYSSYEMPPSLPKMLPTAACMSSMAKLCGSFQLSRDPK